MTDSDLVQLIMDVEESLEREIREGFSQVNAKLDRQEAILDWFPKSWPAGHRTRR
jgi:hypothetical protein